MASPTWGGSGAVVLATPSPWFGRASFTQTFTSATTINFTNFNANSPAAGTSGITVDSSGIFTLPSIGKYVIHMTGKVLLGGISSSMTKANITASALSNATFTGEDLSVYAGHIFIDNNTALITPYAGTGLINATAANSKFQLVFNATNGNVTNLNFNISVTITYVG